MSRISGSPAPPVAQHAEYSSGRRSVDEVVDGIAASQYGLVTRVQLLAAGVTSAVVQHRVRTGRLRRIFRGVYLAGPLELPFTRERAAVLACGTGSVVSHRSAGVLWELAVNDEPDVAMTVPGRDRGRHAGIVVHRVALLPETDVAVTDDGIPVTSAARTLIDLCGGLTRRELERGVASAERRGLITRADLLSALKRRPHVRGAGDLRRLLEGTATPAFTRSVAEDRFLELCRGAKLPEPAANVKVSGHEVDFLFRAARLIVEVDGFAFHSSHASFQNDRRRDARLAARGFRVMRVTWQQLVDEPQVTLVSVAQALVAPR